MTEPRLMQIEVTFTSAQVACGAVALKFALEPETWPVFLAYLTANSDWEVEPEETRAYTERAMVALAELAEGMAAHVGPPARFVRKTGPR